MPTSALSCEPTPAPFNALREDQIDLRNGVRGLRAEMHRSFAAVTGSLGQIVELLGRRSLND